MGKNWKVKKKSTENPLKKAKNGDFWVSGARFEVKMNVWDKLDARSVSASRKSMTYVLVDQIKM